MPGKSCDSIERALNPDNKDEPLKLSTRLYAAETLVYVEFPTGPDQPNEACSIEVKSKDVLKECTEGMVAEPKEGYAEGNVCVLCKHHGSTWLFL